MTNQQQKEQYLQILDQFPNPIWRSGLDAKCNYFNKSWLEYTGRTIDQEMGDGWAQGVHPDDLDRCFKTYMDSFKEKRPFSMEYRLKYHDGSYHWLLDAGSPFFDDNGIFQGYIGSCYDINRNKEYKLLFSGMISGFAYHELITDASGKPIDYQFIDINPTFEKIIGKSREEIVGRKVTQVLPGIESDPANWIQKYGEVALKGREIEFENYSQPLSKWFHVSAYSPIKGTFVTIFEDITHIKHSKKEVDDKLDELNKMNKIMVGRELKMHELKMEIAELKKKLEPTTAS